MNLVIVLPLTITSAAVKVYFATLLASAKTEKSELFENKRFKPKLSDLRGGGKQGKGTGCDHGNS